MTLTRSISTPVEARTFHAKGWIVLRELISVRALNLLNDEILRMPAFSANFGKCLQAKNPYLRAFDKVANLWTISPGVRHLVFESGLAEIASTLMQVRGIRLSHDQCLFKPPAAAETPIHADQYHWPVSSENTLTAWIPLQTTTPEMGAIRYFEGSHLLNEDKREQISMADMNHAQDFFARGPFPQVNSTFNLGDVGFHYGWTFHAAGANESDQIRGVLTVVFMEDGIRLIKPRSSFPDVMLSNWCPGQTYGDILASKMNPRLYPVE